MRHRSSIGEHAVGHNPSSAFRLPSPALQTEISRQVLRGGGLLALAAPSPAVDCYLIHCPRTVPYNHESQYCPRWVSGGEWLRACFAGFGKVHNCPPGLFMALAILVAPVTPDRGRVLFKSGAAETLEALSEKDICPTCPSQKRYVWREMRCCQACSTFRATSGAPFTSFSRAAAGHPRENLHG